MRITHLLLFISFVCLVSAKYLPDEGTSRALLRNKRSVEDESDNTAENQSNQSDEDDDDEDDDDEDNDSLEQKSQKEIEKQQQKHADEQGKLQAKRLKEEYKRVEQLEKQQRQKEKEEAKLEEEHRKFQEKLEKEKRKHDEKLVKEEHKREEKLAKEERKREEKLAKEERKRQEKVRKQLEKIEKTTIRSENKSANSLESGEDLDFEDIWQNYIYQKAGLTESSSDLEKDTAVNRYMQEEFGLNANSTKTEYRQAVLQLVQNKLNASTADNVFKNYFVSHVNAIHLQGLQADIEQKIAELDNDTALLEYINLPWAPEARQAIGEERSILSSIAQFLSDIVPTWITGGQPASTTSTLSSSISSASVDDASVTESSNSFIGSSNEGAINASASDNSVVIDSYNSPNSGFDAILSTVNSSAVINDGSPHTSNADNTNVVPSVVNTVTSDATPSVNTNTVAQPSSSNTISNVDSLGNESGGSNVDSNSFAISTSASDLDLGAEGSNSNDIASINLLASSGPSSDGLSNISQVPNGKPSEVPNVTEASIALSSSASDVTSNNLSPSGSTDSLLTESSISNTASPSTSTSSDNVSTGTQASSTSVTSNADANTQLSNNNPPALNIENTTSFNSVNSIAPSIIVEVPQGSTTEQPNVVESNSIISVNGESLLTSSDATPTGIQTTESVSSAITSTVTNVGDATLLTADVSETLTQNVPSVGAGALASDNTVTSTIINDPLNIVTDSTNSVVGSNSVSVGATVSASGATDATTSETVDVISNSVNDISSSTVVENTGLSSVTSDVTVQSNVDKPVDIASNGGINLTSSASTDVISPSSTTIVPSSVTDKVDISVSNVIGEEHIANATPVSLEPSVENNVNVMASGTSVTNVVDVVSIITETPITVGVETSVSQQSISDSAAVVEAASTIKEPAIDMIEMQSSNVTVSIPETAGSEIVSNDASVTLPAEVSNTPLVEATQTPPSGTVVPVSISVISEPVIGDGTVVAEEIAPAVLTPETPAVEIAAVSLVDATVNVNGVGSATTDLVHASVNVPAEVGNTLLTEVSQTSPSVAAVPGIDVIEIQSSNVTDILPETAGSEIVSNDAIVTLPAEVSNTPLIEATQTSPSGTVAPVSISINSEPVIGDGTGVSEEIAPAILTPERPAVEIAAVSPVDATVNVNDVGSATTDLLQLVPASVSEPAEASNTPLIEATQTSPSGTVVPISVSVISEPVIGDGTGVTEEIAPAVLTPETPAVEIAAVSPVDATVNVNDVGSATSDLLQLVPASISVPAEVSNTPLVEATQTPPSGTVVPVSISVISEPVIGDDTGVAEEIAPAVLTPETPAVEIAAVSPVDATVNVNDVGSATSDLLQLVPASISVPAEVSNTPLVEATQTPPSGTIVPVSISVISEPVIGDGTGVAEEIAPAVLTPDTPAVEIAAVLPVDATVNVNDVGSATTDLVPASVNAPVEVANTPVTEVSQTSPSGPAVPGIDVIEIQSSNITVTVPEIAGSEIVSNDASVTLPAEVSNIPLVEGTQTTPSGTVAPVSISVISEPLIGDGTGVAEGLEPAVLTPETSAVEIAAALPVDATVNVNDVGSGTTDLLQSPVTEGSQTSPSGAEVTSTETFSESSVSGITGVAQELSPTIINPVTADAEISTLSSLDAFVDVNTIDSTISNLIQPVSVALESSSALPSEPTTVSSGLSSVGAESFTASSNDDIPVLNNDVPVEPEAQAVSVDQSLFSAPEIVATTEVSQAAQNTNIPTIPEEVGASVLEVTLQ